MTRTSKIATTVACLLAFAGAVRADDSSPESAVAATAISVSGDVRLQAGQASSAVQEGQVFTSGDRVVTGDDSTLQLVLADGSSVALGQDSELTLDEAGSGDEGSVTLLTLARGLLDAMVQKLKLGSTFEIKTAYAVAAVKGTDFEVSGADAGSSVTVNQGVVQFGDPAGLHREALRPQQRGFYARNRQLSERALSPSEQRAFLGRWAAARGLHARRWQLMRRLRQLPAHRRFMRQMLRRRAFRARLRRGRAFGRNGRRNRGRNGQGRRRRRRSPDGGGR